MRSLLLRMPARRLFPTCAALLSVAYLTSAPAARADTIYSYDFSSNASITIDGQVEAISGSFEYDATDSEVVSPDITITGSFVTDTFTVINDTCPPGPDNQICTLDDETRPNNLNLVFSTPLSNDAPDLLTSQSVYIDASLPADDQPPQEFVATDASGCALPTGNDGPCPSPPPMAMSEPSSLPLFLGAMLLLGFGARRRAAFG